MKLIFNGHTFKYEIESICKLFFPCVKFELEYDTFDFKQDNFIFTRVKQGKDKTLCYSVFKIDGRVLKKSVSLKNITENFEKECEMSLCTVLYHILSAYTKVKPEWGILTGIRPVKRIQKYMSENKSDSEINKILKNKYLVSENKINLGLLTAKAQLPLLNSADNFSYSLYVAIPFCPSRCSYCSFISQSATDKKIFGLIPDYLSCLYKELKATATLVNKLGLKLKTVYIGGGTPTVLSAEQLRELTDTINSLFDLSDIKEYTVEAGRPDSITEDKLRAIKASGATRISINPQTFNDEVLKEIGRKHTSEQFFESFNMARRLGFDNINTDFIAGLPMDTIKSFKNSIDTAINLSPENITVHTLSMKKAARLYTEKPVTASDEERVCGEMIKYALDNLLKNGYHPYYLYRQKNTVENLENVGFAKAGYDGLYNVYIMEETHTILANGASASTKLVNIDNGYIERVFNYKYPFEYINDFDTIIDRKREVINFYAEQFNHRFQE